MSAAAQREGGAAPLLLSALLDQVDDALLGFDAQWRLAACNAAARRLLGCAAGQPAAQALAALGPDVGRWLGGAMRGQPAPSCAVTLPGGRHARLVLRAAGDAWTLRVESAGAGAAVTAAHATAALPRGPGGFGAAALPRAGGTTSRVRELARLLWATPLPVLLQDTQHRLVDANDAFCELTGRKREALRGHDPLGLAPTADRAAGLAARAQPGPAGAPAPLQRLLDADGRERVFRAVVLPVQRDDGAALRLSVLQEVPGDAAAAAGLPAGDDESRWFDLGPSAMLVYDAGGRVLRTNPALDALLGGVPPRLQAAPAELQTLLGWAGGAPLAALRPGAAALARRAVLLPPAAAPLHLEAWLTGFTAGSGGQRVLAVLQDRSAEAERDIAQHEIGALMDAAGIGIATYDREHGWLQPPRSGSGAGGVAGTGGLQGIGRELVAPESRAEYERLQQALRRGERAEARYAVQHPQLGPRWLLTRIEPAQLAGDRSATSVVTLDVTEQERAQRRNEQLLRELTTILDGSPAGIASLRNGVLVRCNGHFERLLGRAAGSAEGATLAALLGAPADGDAWPAQIAAALDAGRPFETELPWPPGAAAPAWYSLSVRRADAEAGDAGTEAVAVLTDITRLKSQQRDLESLLRERELMFSLSEVGIVYRLGGRIERANQAMAELTGYAAAELAALDESALYDSPRDCVDFESRIDHALRQHGRFVGERRLRRRDGRLVWVQVAVRPVDSENVGTGTIASYVDVDERHRAREALQTQAERTRAILDSVLVGIVTVRDGGIEWMNRSARRMFAGELADFVGEPIGTVAGPEPDHPLRRTDWLARLDEGHAETFECRLTARDGRAFWVVGNAVVTGGNAAEQQLTFALLDIERRRQAEIRIAQAQQSLQRVIETAPAAIALFDGAGDAVLQMNQTAAQLLGGGAVAGGALQDLLLAAGDDGAVVHRELRHGPDDAARTWDARVVVLPPAAPGSDAQRLLVASDVTEQRAADERRLQAAIAQRDLLVREVHHRIKNNLQGVAGLLQQAAGRQPAVAPMLTEAVGQVQAIAQVYGLQVGGGGPLPLASVLEAIAPSVQRTFGRAVRCEIVGEAVRGFLLPEADSIPVALTLNELMTNAIKHGSGDEVRCRLELRAGDGAAAAGGDDTIVVTISSAARLPAGFALDRVPSGVTGLGLVRALLPRRSATLAIEQRGDEVAARVVLRAAGSGRLPGA